VWSVEYIEVALCLAAVNVSGFVGWMWKRTFENVDPDFPQATTLR
jgi:hypothetical protein